MNEVDRLIRERLHVKHGDNLPYTGWGKPGREELVKLFADLGFNSGAEIGVSIGRFSESMCLANPNLKLLCVDPWYAYNRLSQEKADMRYALAKRRLSKYNCVLIKKTSLDASVDVPDRSLDFVYIDGAHDFDNVMLDLIIWSNKVRRGGIVSGHDFYYFYQSGVVQAVLAYTNAHNITSWYITTGEREPSFAWVNP